MEKRYTKKIVVIGVLFLLLGASFLTFASATNETKKSNIPLSRDGSIVWEDNFDSYTAGTLLGGQGGWFPWENDPNADANVTNDQSRSPSNSAELKGTSDMVREWEDVKYGNCTLRAWAYVPADFEGQNFLILLSLYGGAASKWSLQIYFDSETFMLRDYDSINETPYVIDDWGEIRVEIDFINDWQDVYYNDVLWLSKSWTEGATGGGILQLGAVDLWANGASVVYWDDLSVWATDAPNEPELKVESVQGPIGVTATVKNTGVAPATNVNWTMSLDGGLILIGKTASGSIPEILPGGSAEIKIPFVIGFGKTVIAITAECDEGASVSASQEATVLLFLVLIK